MEIGEWIQVKMTQMCECLEFFERNSHCLKYSFKYERLGSYCDNVIKGCSSSLFLFCFFKHKEGMEDFVML